MFNATVLHHLDHADNQGVLENAEIIGQEGFPGEGPYMVLYLHFAGEQVAAARFETYGCPAAIACGNWITQWLPGKTVEMASVIEADDLMRMLGGLPLGKEHCALLAIKTLRSALRRAAAPASNDAPVSNDKVDRNIADSDIIDHDIVDSAMSDSAVLDSGLGIRPN